MSARAPECGCRPRSGPGSAQVERQGKRLAEGRGRDHGRDVDRQGQLQDALGRVDDLEDTRRAVHGRQLEAQRQTDPRLVAGTDVAEAGGDVDHPVRHAQEERRRRELSDGELVASRSDLAQALRDTERVEPDGELANGRRPRHDAERVGEGDGELRLLGRAGCGGRTRQPAAAGARHHDTPEAAEGDGRQGLRNVHVEVALEGRAQSVPVGPVGQRSARTRPGRERDRHLSDGSAQVEGDAGSVQGDRAQGRRDVELRGLGQRRRRCQQPDQREGDREPGGPSGRPGSRGHRSRGHRAPPER